MRRMDFIQTSFPGDGPRHGRCLGLLRVGVSHADLYQVQQMREEDPGRN